MKVRGNKVVETSGRRHQFRLNQETNRKDGFTKLKDGFARMLPGNNCMCKFSSIGGNIRLRGVGFVLANHQIMKVIFVNRANNPLVHVRVTGTLTVCL